MSRAPAAFSDFVRGKATNYPFFPGGMEDIALHDLNGDKNAHTIDVELEELLGIVCNDDDEGGGGSSTLFMTVPPGFDRGMHFHSTAATTTTSTSTSSTSTGSTATTTHTASVNVLDVFASSAVDEDLLEMLAGAPLAEQLANTRLNNSVSPTTTETKIITSEQHAQEIDKLLPSTTTTINTITNPSSKRNMAPSLKEWAHVIDVNLPFPDFHSLVPDMAFQYPFELDVFQKQAVFHLEQGDSVFVAAHTSAGKTVVAEYAIALAAKHMTR